jgi:hypothetical protein
LLLYFKDQKMSGKMSDDLVDLPAVIAEIEKGCAALLPLCSAIKAIKACQTSIEKFVSEMNTLPPSQFGVPEASFLEALRDEEQRHRGERLRVGIDSWRLFVDQSALLNDADAKDQFPCELMSQFTINVSILVTEAKSLLVGQWGLEGLETSQPKSAKRVRAPDVSEESMSDKSGGKRTDEKLSEEDTAKCEEVPRENVE